MRDVPLVNPALCVEAAAFRPWNDRALGVLIAPWAFNLVLLPGEDEPLPRLVLGQIHTWTLPGGAVDFMGGSEPECGHFHFCPLFSPPSELPDQETALAVARELVDGLLAVPAGAPVQPQRRAFLTGRRGV